IFIDTPAAYPGMESEERGVAEAIAVNLREMMLIEVPIVVIVCGEGGSGGALGIAIGDRVLMQEYSVYSVIPPEGCAAILWRDANRKIEAATALKITASDLVALGLVDGIIPEPAGGAHNDYESASALLDPDAAARFLSPSLEHLHDPFLMAGMSQAVERLERAIAARERIAIHGDYDVDGITSTVILRRALEMLGGDVVHFIPERLRDGYGLQPSAIERLHGEAVRLVVSVDCGIRGTDAALRARELGVDLIITDHHEPDATLPPAVAVV